MSDSITPNDQAETANVSNSYQQPLSKTSKQEEYKTQTEMLGDNLDAMAQKIGYRQLGQPLPQQVLQGLEQELNQFHGQTLSTDNIVYLLKRQGKIHNRLLEISLYGPKDDVEVKRLFRLLDRLQSFLE